MIALRALWFWLTTVVLAAYYSLTAIVAGLLGVPYRKGGVYDRAGRLWSTRVLQLNGVHVEVSGYEHIPTGGPCVYISNHFSFADIWVLFSTLPDSLRFISKQELFKVPLLGFAMRKARHISIDRKNLVKAFSAYEEAAQAVRDGVSAVVFAEGTRSRNGQLQAFKKGPFVLAIAAGVPVVPIWVGGTYEAFPPGALVFRRRPVVIRIGTPISTTGMTYDDRDHLSRQAHDAVVAMSGRIDG
ncbi:MAG: lysophospholipid acyltransferase family protein [Gemmatimonadales bacterium]